MNLKNNSKSQPFQMGIFSSQSIEDLFKDVFLIDKYKGSEPQS